MTMSMRLIRSLQFYFCEYYQKIVNQFPNGMGLNLGRCGVYWASWGFGKYVCWNRYMKINSLTLLTGSLLAQWTTS